MKIGISTASFYPEDLLESIDTVGKLGFKDVEIFVNTESEYSKEFAQKIKQKLDYYNISVTSIHSYTAIMEGIYFFSDYPKRTDDSLKQYQKYFEYGEYLGAKFFTFHGERSMLASFNDNKVSRDIETYKRLCNLANSKNMSLAQENVAYCYSEKPEFLENLYKNVPNLKYTLDIKQANRSHHDVFSYVDVMRDRICNIHANDFDQNHDCMLPGDGIFDYCKLTKELQKYNYFGNFLIEVYRTNYKKHDEILTSKNFLQNLLNR